MAGVIVVGGGFAGVSTAAELERRGVGPVVLLEASDRVGGRARSTPVPGADGLAVDLGAHYFGRQHRRVRALADRLVPADAVFDRFSVYGPDPAFRIHAGGVWRVTSHESSFFGIQGLPKKAPLAHVTAIFDSLCRFLALESRIDVEHPWRTRDAAALDAQSAAEWIDRQPVPSWIHDMWRLALIDIQSVYPEDVSLLYWLWYVASNGGFLHITNDFEGGPQEFAVDIGLGGLLERFAAELTGEVRVGSPATRIDHSAPDRVVVLTADGVAHEADHVVVAVTPAVAGAIAYTPELSPARQRLHADRPGHAAKAVVFYDEPWWWASHGFHHIGYSGGARRDGIEWILDTSHPSRRQHSLTGFVSDVLLDRAGPDPDDRRRAVIAAMVDVTGDERAAAPSHVEIFDWRTQPWIGGGPDTCFGTGSLTGAASAFNQPEGPHHRLWFTAAEYSTSYTGYVEGALAAGERVAARIAGAPPPDRARGPRPARAALFTAARIALTPLAGAVRWRAKRRGWPAM